jgi:hypothetical protein
LTFPAIQEVISQRVLSPGRTFYHFVNVKEPECIFFDSSRPHPTAKLILQSHTPLTPNHWRFFPHARCQHGHRGSYMGPA